MANRRSILLLCAAILPALAFSAAHVSNEGHPQTQTCSELLIRKEWRTLHPIEKTHWVAAVKCLAGIRHERLSFAANRTVLEGRRSLYDDFSYSHALLAQSAHRTGYFLPWHRWFTYLFDASLRRSCGYYGPTPYWDWSRDHADLFSAPVFESSPVHGLGGKGDCDDADCTVGDGAFAPSNGNFELAWPVPHALRRNLTLLTGWFPNERPQNSTLSPDSVRSAAEHAAGDFFKFQHAMELLHNHVHNFVGGDLGGDCPKAVPAQDCVGMAESFTPNDPLFWLHHAQLDRLWSEWQRRDRSNLTAFAGTPLERHNLTLLPSGLDAYADHRMSFDVHSVSVTPRMVLHTESWPLCYRLFG